MRTYNNFFKSYLLYSKKLIIKKKIHKLEEKLLGYCQQLNLIRILEDEESITPPIFDATDILEKPEQALKKICTSVGIRFSQNMLKWPKGKRTKFS